MDKQTVRIEADNTATIKEGVNGIIGWHRVVIFGVRNHESIPDTDIQRSDMFVINNIKYQVMSIMTPPGEIQAYCEATKST